MHRVGRTGRFGTRGLAVTFTTEAELQQLTDYVKDASGAEVTAVSQPGWVYFPQSHLCNVYNVIRYPNPCNMKEAVSNPNGKVHSELCWLFGVSVDNARHCLLLESLVTTGK